MTVDSPTALLQEKASLFNLKMDHIDEDLDKREKDIDKNDRRRFFDERIFFGAIIEYLYYNNWTSVPGTFYTYLDLQGLETALATHNVYRAVDLIVQGQTEVFCGICSDFVQSFYISKLYQGFSHRYFLEYIAYKVETRRLTTRQDPDSSIRAFLELMDMVKDVKEKKFFVMEQEILEATATELQEEGLDSYKLSLRRIIREIRNITNDVRASMLSAASSSSLPSTSSAASPCSPPSRSSAASPCSPSRGSDPWKSVGFGALSRPALSQPSGAKDSNRGDSGDSGKVSRSTSKGTISEASGLSSMACSREGSAEASAAAFGSTGGDSSARGSSSSNARRSEKSKAEASDIELLNFRSDWIVEINKTFSRQLLDEPNDPIARHSLETNETFEGMAASRGIPAESSAKQKMVDFKTSCKASTEHKTATCRDESSEVSTKTGETVCIQKKRATESATERPKEISAAEGAQSTSSKATEQASPRKSAVKVPDQENACEESNTGLTEAFPSHVKLQPPVEQSACENIHFSADQNAETVPEDLNRQSGSTSGGSDTDKSD